jgi:hypothetical protein
MLKKALCSLLVLYSVPSVALSTKDFWIPQTKTLEYNQFRFDLNATGTLIKSSQVSSANSNKLNSNWSAGLSYGLISNENMGAEIGVDWSEPSTEDYSEALLFNARVRALSIEDDGFSVAIGIESLGFKPAVSDFNIIHLVFENRFWQNWIGVLGGYAGSSSTLLDDQGASDPRGFLLGVRRVSPDKKEILGLEYQSGKNRFGYLTAGASFELKKDVFGTVLVGTPNNRNLLRDILGFKLAVLF